MYKCEIDIGDDVVLLVHGPYGSGLVPARVQYLHRRTMNVGRNRQMYLIDEEGITWIRGSDMDSPEAAAMLVASAL